MNYRTIIITQPNLVYFNPDNNNNNGNDDSYHVLSTNNVPAFGKYFIYVISTALKVWIIVPILQMNALSLKETQVLPQNSNAVLKIQPQISLMPRFILLPP